MGVVEEIGCGAEEPAGWAEEDAGGVEAEMADSFAALVVGDEFGAEPGNVAITGGWIGSDITADEFEEGKAGAEAGERCRGGGGEPGELGDEGGGGGHGFGRLLSINGPTEGIGNKKFG